MWWYQETFQLLMSYHYGENTSDSDLLMRTSHLEGIFFSFNIQDMPDIKNVLSLSKSLSQKQLGPPGGSLAESASLMTCLCCTRQETSFTQTKKILVHLCFLHILKHYDWHSSLSFFFPVSTSIKLSFNTTKCI